MSALTHDQRRERRKAIAETARIEGVPEAARIHNVTCATVRNSCEEHGIKAAKNHIFASSQNSGFQILRELLYTAKSYSEIGREFKVTRQAIEHVSKRAEKAGFDVPKRHHNPALNHA